MALLYGDEPGSLNPQCNDMQGLFLIKPPDLLKPPDDRPENYILLKTSEATASNQMVL